MFYFFAIKTAYAISACISEPVVSARCWNERHDERRFSKVERRRRNWRKNRPVFRRLCDI